MAYGMILNIITCFLISGIAFFTARNIYSRQIKRTGGLAFGLFWFLVGWQWLFSGFRTIAAFFGKLSWDKNFYYAVEILVGIYAVPLIYFLVIRATKKSNVANVFGFITLLNAIAYVYFVATRGVHFVSASYFATEYRPNDTTHLYFIVLFVFVLVILLYDIVIEVIRKIKASAYFDRQMFICLLSLLFYAVSGYFDHTGEPNGWKLIMIRAFIAGSVFLGYMAYVIAENKEEKENLVV